MLMDAGITRVIPLLVLNGLQKRPVRNKVSREILASTISWAIYGAARKWFFSPERQRGGIHNNLVGIKNLCVECHAPGLVANGTAAVLTRGLGIVTVVVKPRGWSLVRHKANLEMTKAAN